MINNNSTLFNGITGMHLLVLVLSLVMFAGLVIYLALGVESRKRITGISFFIAVIGGIFFYSSYYVEMAAVNSESPMMAILPTLIAVGRMFVGVNGPMEQIVGIAQGLLKVPLEVCTFFYWLVHFLAYYSMASAAILALGEGMVRRLRLLLNMVSDIELIYGVNDTSLAIGRVLSEKRGTQVVFVGKASEEQRNAIRHMKSILLEEKWAQKPGKELLKKLSVKKGRGRLALSALSEDINSNLTFALDLRDCLKKNGIKPHQTSLVLLGQEELDGATLLAKGERYGYGFVKVFECEELVARLLMQKFPLCDVMAFDDDGRAKNDLNVLIYGFGRTGQEILRKIISNGQFEGSTLHVHVFDPQNDIRAGFFKERYATMLEQYDVSFHPYAAQSAESYNFVREHAKELDYIVVAVGVERESREIANELLALLKRAGNLLPIARCSRSGVIYQRLEGEAESYYLQDAEFIYGGAMDEIAKQINHHYLGNQGSADQNWMNCDYYSRMSSRASADYLSALFKKLGIKDKNDLNPKTLENLAKSEHQRWCAFHYSMEFCGMSREEWNKRAEDYVSKLEAWRQSGEGDAPRLSVGKDMVLRHHACLIDWDALDELSERENELRQRTGNPKTVDYKEMDREAVLTVLEIKKSISKS